VLRDRCGAIVAQVADRDPGLPGRIEIDVVHAGRGERDEAQRGIGADRRAVDHRLVGEDSFASSDAAWYVRLLRPVVDHDAGQGALERAGVEVAVADRTEVQEHRTHRAISRENS
jgi:hypothetical protein